MANNKKIAGANYAPHPMPYDEWLKTQKLAPAMKNHMKASYERYCNHIRAAYWEKVR